MSPSSTHEKDVNLTKVEVLFFDLDGAILDWEGTVAKELRRQGDRYFPEREFSAGFPKESGL
jgi:hypothetical protein